MMSNKYRKSISGFTLLEILIALAILAIVMSIIFGAYSSTFRVIDSAESQAELYQMARMTLERLREDLECSLVSTDPNISENFLGKDEEIEDRDADFLSFLSAKHLPLDDEDHYTGFSRISFYVEENDEDEGEAKGLILYRSDTKVNEARPEEKTGGLVLCEDLYTVNFLYYDEDGNEHDSWDSSETAYDGKVPHMVTIQLQFIDKSDPEEPISFETGVAVPMAKTVYP